jgi:hypothetical protein
MFKDGVKESNRNVNPGSALGETVSLADDLELQDRFTPVAFRVLMGDSPEDGRGDTTAAKATPD